MCSTRGAPFRGSRSSTSASRGRPSDPVAQARCAWHESARLFSKDSSWHLVGTAVFAHERQPCRLDYVVVRDSGWRTVSGRVTGWVGDATIEVELSVDSARRWWLNGVAWPTVERSIDLDLNFSPSTNLLPIRRLGLVVGQEAAVQAERGGIRHPISGLLGRRGRRGDARDAAARNEPGRPRRARGVARPGGRVAP